MVEPRYQRTEACFSAESIRSRQRTLTWRDDDDDGDGGASAGRITKLAGDIAVSPPVTRRSAGTGTALTPDSLSAGDTFPGRAALAEARRFRWRRYTVADAAGRDANHRATRCVR